MPDADQAVGLTNKRHRIQIFATAMHIRQPFAWRSAVIQIQHRRHCVDPQPGHTIALKPEERIGRKKIAYFVPTIIVDQRVPVRMQSLTRIGVFVETGAVKARQRMRVCGEVPRYPIQQDTYARRMEAPDQCGKVRRRPMARRWRVKPGRLISPGAVERMLHHRHEFDVSKSHFDHVGQQPVGQFPPREKPTGTVASPGSRMHLVDG